MTDFTALSDKELSEAIDFHRRQRNMSRGINESMHMRQTQTVRLLEAEEARRLEEVAAPAYHYYVTKNDVGPGKKKLTHSKNKPFATERDAFEHILKSGGRQSGIIHKVHTETGKIVQNRGVDSGQRGYASDVSGDDPLHTRDLKEEIILDEAKVEPKHTFQVGDVVHLNHHQLGHRHYHGTANVDKATSAYVHITHPASKNIKLKFAQGVGGHGGKEVGTNPGSRQGGYMISKGKVHDSFKEEVELDEAAKEYHVVHRAASLTSAQMKGAVPGDQPTFHKTEADAIAHLNKKYKKVRDGVWKDNKDQFYFHKKKSTVKEEVEQIDENGIKGWKNAASDIAKMRSAQGKNVKLVSLKKDGTESKMHDAAKIFRSEDEAQEHHDRVTKLNPKSKIRHNMYVDGKHVKTLGEEVEQIDELSNDTVKSYWKKAAENRYPLDVKARKAETQKTARIRSGKPLAGYTPKDALTPDEKRVHTNRIKGMQHAGKRLFRSEEVELDEAAIDKNHPIVKEYQALKKHDIKTLRGMIAGQRRISDTSEFKTKDHAISSYLRSKHGNKNVDKAFGFNEEVELDEAADLRITKIYNKWPKKATYAVHTPDRKYFKEFDSMDAAKAHHNEKTVKEEVVYEENTVHPRGTVGVKLDRHIGAVGADRLDRDSGEHKLYSRYIGSQVRRAHTVTDKDNHVLGSGLSAAAAMAKAKLKKSHRDALMHDDNQIVTVHNTAGSKNVGTQVKTPSSGRWFKDHDEAMAYAKTLPGKIRHADPKTGHVD